MKKLSFIIMSFITIFTLISCQKKESIDDPMEFETGDTVEYNGVIYEYIDYNEIPMTYQDNLEYVFEEEEDYKAFYHTYYIDMSDYKSQPNLREDIKKQGWEEFIDENCILESPTKAYALHVRFFFENFFRSSTSKQSFIVKGYTDDLPKDVVLPMSIHGHSMTQIGYRAFENAPMETLTFKWYSALERGCYILVHPYAISNCENLKEINFDTLPGAIMSMGISNCNNLERVKGIMPTMDCSFYNLPKLKEVNEVSLLFNWEEKPIFSTCYGLGGIRKSFFYNCPKIKIFTEKPYDKGTIGIVNNTVYYQTYYAAYPIYVFDNFAAMIDDGVYSYGFQFYTLLYNPDTLEAYVPLLNDGLNKKGTFLFLHRFQDSSSVIEDETGIYINAIYYNEAYNNKILFQKKN